MTPTTALPASAVVPSAGTLPANLASQLKRAERRKRLFSISLTLPLLVFLVVIFIVPIGALLIRAVENPEARGTSCLPVCAMTWPVSRNNLTPVPWRVGSTAKSAVRDRW